MSDSRKKPDFRINIEPASPVGDEKKAINVKTPSLKSPRTARFAEATAVHSPIEPSQNSRLPFGPPSPLSSNHYMAQPQPSDVGFGYVNRRHESVEMPDTDTNEYPKMPSSPLKSPLKSALKSPGGPPRDFGASILSPTFKEEQFLDKHENYTEKIQAQDIVSSLALRRTSIEMLIPLQKVKTRVRIAKFLLRGVNFSCSLIVLAMLATTFTIFNATKSIPARNNLPPWANNQMIWPQVTLLCIACVSLLASLIVFYGYWKGGHKRAEKIGVYYTVIAVSFFIFSIVMWGIGAGLLQGAKNNSNNKDMWGWSCVDNTRKQFFQDDVSYDLICRLQNWSLLCCIIEVVVETITIVVYGIVFYRFYSKRKLRKSMANRDRARSQLYSAHIRSQPNTPGFAAGPFSPGFYGPKSPYTAGPTIEEGSAVQYVDPVTQRATPKPFQLQPAPKGGSTPKSPQNGFSPIDSAGTVIREQQIPTPASENAPAAMRSPMVINTNMIPLGPMSPPPMEQRQEHFGPMAGETVYEAVPIPGAYEGPPMSPRGPVARPY